MNLDFSQVLGQGLSAPWCPEDAQFLGKWSTLCPQVPHLHIQPTVDQTFRKKLLLC